MSVEDVIPSNIVNIVDDTSVVCDVWQMEDYRDYVADGKAMYKDDNM